MKKRMLVLIVGVFLMGACSTSGTPVKQFVKGNDLAFYDFTSPASFEEGLYGEGNGRLQIVNGVYTISVAAGDSTLYYGQWGAPQSDVVINVQARQTTADLNTTYGVMCRARGTVGETVKADATAEATDAPGSDNIIASPDSEATAEATSEGTAEATAEATQEPTVQPTRAATATGEATPEVTVNTANNGDGYLFMLQGNGRYAIFRSQAGKLTALVNWASSSAVNMGAAQNNIQAVCMGSYLALYANGQFLADATDDMYTSGQVGLVGAAASTTGMQVTFDNLSVSEAKPQ